MPYPYANPTPAVCRPLSPGRQLRLERIARRGIHNERVLFATLAALVGLAADQEAAVTLAERAVSVPTSLLRALGADRLPPRPVYVVGADGHPQPVRVRS